MKHWVGVIAFLFGAVGPVYSYQSVDYLRDVKPVFASNCYGCHGAKVQMAGLRLDTGAAILKGSMSGPVVVPGSSAESKLIRAVTGAGGAVRMPFKRSRASKPGSTRERKFLKPSWPRTGEGRKHTGRSCHRCAPRFPKSTIHSGSATKSIDLSSPVWKKKGSHRLRKRIA